MVDCYVIRGALLPRQDGGLDRADILLADGVIAEGPAPADAKPIDGEGLLALPGLIDLHGDAFERQMMPRPGVHFPSDLALLETDRQMLANGITTAYHGLTLSWEPGLRSIQAGRDFIAALDAVRPRLACDTRLHLRFETYNLDALEEAIGWIETGKVDLLAFNNHVPDIMQKTSTPSGTAKYADRAGMDAEAFRALLADIAAREAQVPAAMARLAAAGLAAGLPMASHDDESPAMRDDWQALGASICEFPLNEATARHARDAGSFNIMGAPNILRGGSHAGRLGAMDMVRQGLCDVLTSDYYYPSMIEAAFRIARDGVMPLAQAWALISTNPARAAGLNDRGRIAAGLRGDILLVDGAAERPDVRAVFVAGRPVLQRAAA